MSSFAEAQYAQSLQKNIIPLKCEEYKPTSWLGLMINALLYYDVQTEESMMGNLPAIKRALEKQGVSRRSGSSGKAWEPNQAATFCSRPAPQTGLSQSS